MQYARRFWFFGIIYLTVNVLWVHGQAGFPAYARLLPAYAENFSAKCPLPQTCASDVITDRRGRLWVATCPVMAGVNAVRLFLFDGYDFQPVNLANDSIPDRTLAVLKQITPDGELLGWFQSNRVNTLFFFDPDRHTARTVRFDPAREGLIRDLAVQPDGRVLVLLLKPDSLRLCRLDRAQRKECLAAWSNLAPNAAQASCPFQEASLFVAGDEALVVSNCPIGLFQVQLSTGRCRAYPLAGFSPLLHSPAEEEVLISDKYSARFAATPRGEVLCFMPDAQPQVFVRRNAGAPFEPMPGLPSGSSVCRMEKDSAGNILFLLKDAQGKYAGLLYDREGNRYDYSAFVADHARIYNLRSANFLQAVFICAEGGLSYKSVREETAVQCLLPGHSIRGMVETNPGQFFITSQNKPAVAYQSASGTIGNPATTAPLLDAFGSGAARSFSRVSEGVFWGNRGDTLVKYFSASGSHRDWAVFPGLFYHALLADGRIVIFSQEQGSFLFDPSSGKSNFLKSGDHLHNYKGLVHCIKQTRDGMLWLLTTNGLLRIDPDRGVEKRLGFEPPFRDFRFLCMEEADDGKLWLGTFLGGIHIYDPATGEVQVVDKSKGLPSNTIASITRDAQGDFWAATYRGLSRLSPDGSVIATFLEEEGLCELEFNRYAALRAQDGSLLLGTVRGLHIIRPESLAARRKASSTPQIYLTSLTVADAQTGADRTIQSSFDHLPVLVLPPDRRHLRLRFALSNYVQSDRNQFAYMLEGVEKDWTPIGPRHELVFNDLPPGEYHLLVKGCDFQGNWTAEPLRIAIRARDFFYKKPWFYALCLLPFVVFGWLWLQRLRSEKRRLEEEVQRRTQQIRQDKTLIEQQARELLHLDELKSRFFTNISHELRTPITLITAPVERLLQKHSGEAYAALRQSLQRVLYNGRKLAALVEELLELSRLEAQKVDLLETPTAFYPYCRQVFAAFESQAHIKHIRYTLRYEADESLHLGMDRRRLEKIINNLIFNALKFTPSEGEVQVTVRSEPADTGPDSFVQVTIQVSDTGRGIPPEDLPHVFERYFQTKRNDLAREGGTGIGLALAKELASLMNGNLQVDSVWGKGSTFTLTLPLRVVPEPVFSEAEPLLGEAVAPLGFALVPAHSASPDRAHILVVEDNPDMRDLLQTLLSDDHALTFANDGQEAWAMMQANDERLHDLSLVLSDVMMPRMAGYELLEKTKSHPRWQRLPVILLTARAEQEDKLQALRLGVDDYLVKPFSPTELSTRAANLIANHRRRATFSQAEKNAPDFVFEKVDAQSDRWLRSIEAAAKAALDKGVPLQVRLLAEAGAVSERQLLREIKRLTGLTTKEYILAVRLQKARHLLQHGAYGTLAEVAYAVGFDTPGYFTKVFESHFGKHPSAYL